MKKFVLLLFMLFFFGLLSGCQRSTTLSTTTTLSTIANPNSDYCSPGKNEGVFVCQKTWSAYFDAPITLKIYFSANDQFILEDVFSEVEEILQTHHELFDKYNAYPELTNVFAINRSLESSIAIDPILFDAIAFALQHDDEVQINGDSLFNIALGPVLNVWHNARENSACVEEIAYSVCPVPNDILSTATFAVDPSQIVLQEELHTISFLEPDMEIDLGGYGKGYVSEVITDYLDALQVRYILNAGNSNVKAGGVNTERDDGLFYIGLVRPVIEFAMPSFYAYLRIPAGVSVVSSGNYQRFFIGEEDQKVYHHIIDPRTNYPGGEAMSVSVIYEDGALADIYSTAIYLMTIQEGLTFVNQTEGLEAIWYQEDGEIVFSENFEEMYLYSTP